MKEASAMSTTVPEVTTTNTTVRRTSGGVIFTVVPEVATTGTNATPSRVTITYPKDGNGAAPEERTRIPFEGPLAIEGKATSDGRYLIPGEIGQRDLPLPIAPSHEDQQATETVGRIESITHIPASEFDKPDWESVAKALEDAPPQAAVIWAEGTFDGSPESQDAIRQMENGVGISVDLPMERQALIDAATYEEVDPRTLSDEEMMGLMFGMVPEGYLQGFGGKIAGASLASIAAFEETSIRIVENRALVASAVRVILPSLTASAAGYAPMAPPREWFFRPEADEPTALTVTSDGEVYGHLALYDQCHTAFDYCEMAPKSRSGYAFFHTGQIETDEGETVNVGRITVGGKGSAKGGHASIVLGTAGAMEHYEKTGCVGAFVRAIDGRHGIWLSGAVRSDAPSERVRDMRANPPSGDWRMEGGSRELVAVLSVPVGGFPMPRYEAHIVATGAAEEEVTALIATGYAPDLIPEFTGAKRRAMVALKRRRKYKPKM